MALKNWLRVFEVVFLLLCLWLAFTGPFASFWTVGAVLAGAILVAIAEMRGGMLERERAGRGMKNPSLGGKR